jgi:outer membrane PBP1 activator LpoA protein
MQSLEELQAALAERIQKLDEERRINAEHHAKEQADMLLEAELERKQRIDEYQAKVAVLEARKQAEEAAKEAQRRQELSERLAAEQKQSVLDETLRLQREKLEWLTKATSEAKFNEEKNRKAMENLRVLPAAEPTGEEVSAEYPQTGADGGAAAKGTEGSTPENELMANHLRQILRQANRP